jgi:hypothetical protein
VIVFHYNNCTTIVIGTYAPTVSYCLLVDVRSSCADHGINRRRVCVDDVAVDKVESIAQGPPKNSKLFAVSNLWFVLPVSRIGPRMFPHLLQWMHSGDDPDRQTQSPTHGGLSDLSGPHWGQRKWFLDSQSQRGGNGEQVQERSDQSDCNIDNAHGITTNSATAKWWNTIPISTIRNTSNRCKWSWRKESNHSPHWPNTTSTTDVDTC